MSKRLFSLLAVVMALGTLGACDREVVEVTRIAETVVVTATPQEVLAPAPAPAPGEVEEITFQSDHFNLVGDLQLPVTEGKHPAILMVHGDGSIDRYDSGKYRPLMERFLRAGYAVFSWDKPGSGESRGKLARDSEVLSQRAAILVRAVEHLKEHPAIDPERIGAWGISQAGYAIPQAMQITDDIAFVILTGGPAVDSYDQGAFLAGQIAFCAGASQAEAKQIEGYVSKAQKVSTYEEYRENTSRLLDHPQYGTLGLSLSLQPQSQWEPEDLDHPAFFNPIQVFEETSIPILAIFGEKDRQVDPFQGSEAFQEAFAKNGVPHSQVPLFPDGDHNVVLSETGCLDERDNRRRAAWLDYAPGYLDLMEEWLVQPARPAYVPLYELADCKFPELAGCEIECGAWRHAFESLRSRNRVAVSGCSHRGARYVVPGRARQPQIQVG